MGLPLFKTKSIGFSLLEVLIALIILSIALLGLVKAQAIAQHENQTAYWQSMANMQLNNLAEHMLACNFDQICWRPVMNQWQLSIQKFFPHVETYIKESSLAWQLNLSWYQNNNIYTAKLFIKP